VRSASTLIKIGFIGFSSLGLLFNACVPLRRLDQMEHDAVFRSAFIVETVQVRVAAKTQRKFAILAISDGIARYELPIWSDLYEERSALLRENQLLYAVLQLDKREEEVRLSCRWLDDLTLANEEMIEACDKAYDKARQNAARFAQHKSQSTEKQALNNKPKEEKPMKPILIKVDADRTKLSQILKLKEWFAEHRGQTPVQIHFHSHAKHLATLHIDSKWGVVMNETFKQKVNQLDCIVHIEE
jgi:DNA polymerase III subunit alpha